MKKLTWIFVLAVLGAGSLIAQSMRVLELQAGYMDPKGTPAGLIFGGNYGISIDERVDVSFGLSYFHKSYKKETTVSSSTGPSGVTMTHVVQNYEYGTSLLPLAFNVTVHVPIQPPLSWYVGGGLSYQFLFQKENNYDDNVSFKHTYKSGGWQLRAGVEYQIGSRSSLILEAFNNNCKVKSDDIEVDVSGIGFKAGVRVLFY